MRKKPRLTYHTGFLGRWQSPVPFEVSLSFDQPANGGLRYSVAMSALILPWLFVQVGHAHRVFWIFSQTTLQLSVKIFWAVHPYWNCLCKHIRQSPELPAYSHLFMDPQIDFAVSCIRYLPWAGLFRLVTMTQRRKQRVPLTEQPSTKEAKLPGQTSQ